MLNWFRKKGGESGGDALRPEDDPGSRGPEGEPPDRETQEDRKGFFQRLKERLTKTRETLVSRVDTLVLGKKEIDEELLEELEEILITSDLGVETSQALMKFVQQKVKRKELDNPEKLKEVLQQEIMGFLELPEHRPEYVEKPYVILVIGVNGVGKTTTIGKMAAQFVRAGKKVLLVSGDTFRAAAGEQLEIWAQRAGTEIIRQKEGSDPSAVVFDALKAARARNIDLVLIDTAGRLHTRVNLMEELKKIRRTIQKELPEGPHQTLLVLDATMGQNAISQARIFHEAMDITGLILTKLDGTAKGGVVVGISHDLKLPICYIGLGEKIEDLQPFNPREFVNAIFS